VTAQELVDIFRILVLKMSVDWSRVKKDKSAAETLQKGQSSLTCNPSVLATESKTACKVTWRLSSFF